MTHRASSVKRQLPNYTTDDQAVEAGNGQAKKKRPRMASGKPKKPRTPRKRKQATATASATPTVPAAARNGDSSADGEASTALPGRLLSSYKAEKLRFFAHPYILLNRLNLVAGASDAGKSTYLGYLMQKAKHTVLYPGFEESIEQDVRPRIDQYGIDPSKVTIIDGTNWKLPDCEGEIIKAVQGYKADLLLFDPGQSYFKDVVSPNDPKLVRDCLEAASRIAAKAPVTVVMVKHSGKDDDNVMSGTAAWKDVPRSVVHLRKDPSDPGKRIIELFKKNRMKGKQSRWYELVGEEGEPPLFVLGESLTDGEQRMVAEADNEALERSLMAMAMDFIRGLLADGEQTAKWMYDQAEAHRISSRTFYRAAVQCGVIMERKGQGKGHHGVWRMPDSV